MNENLVKPPGHKALLEKMINYPAKFTFFIEKGLIYSKLLQVQANKELKPFETVLSPAVTKGCDIR